MEIINISLQNINKSSIIKQLQTSINEGSLIVYPTDTLYGLGADPFKNECIMKINEVKGRNMSQEISVAVTDMTELIKLTELDDVQIETCKKLLPGPVTLILPAGKDAPEPAVTVKGTIGIRMPDAQLTLSLLKHTGPLTVTSANRHGGPEPVDIPTAKAQLGENVSLYLDSGPCRFKVYSTILDLTGERPRILREGVMVRSELEQKLECQVDING
jgi:tRNA threonylcarbamoyl adenosine modification protein (Sua5/YciO/YrdC/YwlC family)